MEGAGTALQLSPIQLGHKLQVDPRSGHAPGDLLLIHSRLLMDMEIQAAPIRAWWAANQQERLARSDKSDRPLAVAREVKVPRLASRAWAQ
eukprot:13355118-Alexandrium_andersonii.AAC.1